MRRAWAAVRRAGLAAFIPASASPKAPCGNGRDGGAKRRVSAIRCIAASAAPPPLFCPAGSARTAAWAWVSTVRMPLPMQCPSSPSSIRPREESLQTVS